MAGKSWFRAQSFDAQATRLARESIEKIGREMRMFAPEMARRSWKWMRSLAGGRHPSAYYTARWDYPILLLPYWLDRRIARRQDRTFRSDIVYSTINGYYFLRMCDNLMDDQATVETDLLPAAGFFHSEFQAPYFKAFPSGHAFWRIYRRNWFGAAEAAILDRELEQVDISRFNRISSRKTCAAKIPLAAVCLRNDRDDLWPLWNDFSDRLARFIQLADDLFDWSEDGERGHAPTYFLSEAQKRRRPGQSAAAWIVSDGFGWGLDLCQRTLVDLRRRATRLDCPELERLLADRQTVLAERGGRMRDALQSLQPVAIALGEESAIPPARPARVTNKQRLRMIHNSERKKLNGNGKNTDETRAQKIG